MVVSNSGLLTQKYTTLLHGRDLHIIYRGSPLSQPLEVSSQYSIGTICPVFLTIITIYLG